MNDHDPDRVIDLSVEVAGTPEEVWDAIATGPGISSWFIPHRFEEHEGATVTMDFGSYGTEVATVTAWEPPHRVVFESSGERAMAFEWLVEAKDGGSCIVRLVNSGFGEGAEWDAEYEGMSEGWLLFLRNLQRHLQDFRGQHARALVPVGALPGPNAAAFAGLCERLGIPDDLEAGDRFATSGDGVPPLSGTVEEHHRSDRATNYMVVLDGPHPGTGFIAAEGDGPDRVVVSTYLYLYGDVPDSVGERWDRFFAERFDTPFPVET